MASVIVLGGCGAVGSVVVRTLKDQPLFSSIRIGDINFPLLGDRIPVYPYPHPEQVTIPKYINLKQVTNRGLPGHAVAESPFLSKSPQPESADKPVWTHG